MIEWAIAIMERELQESSHDIEHSLRVAHNACMLVQNRDDVDIEVLTLASILHDIAKVKEDRDVTRQTDHCIEGARIVGRLLEDIHYDEEKAKKITQAIRYHRDFLPDANLCIETQLLFDAGILENLGAIGIARTFMVAGEFQENMYVAESLEEYIQHNVKMPERKVVDYSKHAPNMEFELHWQDADQLLYTDEAKKIARERILFSRQFFDKLRTEINS